MAAANLGWRYLSLKREQLHQGMHCAKDWHGHPCQSARGAPRGAAWEHISCHVESNRCSGPEVTRRACVVRLGRSPCRNSWQTVKHSPVPRVRTRPASMRHTTHTWPLGRPRRWHSVGRLPLALDSQWQVGAEVKPAGPHSPLLTNAPPLCAKEHWNVAEGCFKSRLMGSPGMHTGGSLCTIR